jgi:hypothetical protein
MQIDDDEIGEKFQFFLNKNRNFASATDRFLDLSGRPARRGGHELMERGARVKFPGAVKTRKAFAEKCEPFARLTALRADHAAASM